MAKLSVKDVRHVADLAELDLTDKEVKKYLPQLSSIIDYISELSKVDTSNAEPTSQTTGLTDVFREDAIDSVGRLSQDQTLSGTDRTHNGYFKVGAILAERTDK